MNTTPQQTISLKRLMALVLFPAGLTSIDMRTAKIKPTSDVLEFIKNSNVLWFSKIENKIVFGSGVR